MPYDRLSHRSTTLEEISASCELLSQDGRYRTREAVVKSERRSVLTRVIGSEENVVTLGGVIERVCPEFPPPDQGGIVRTERLIFELKHAHLPKPEGDGTACDSTAIGRTKPVRDSL